MACQFEKRGEFLSPCYHIAQKDAKGIQNKKFYLCHDAFRKVNLAV